MELPIECASVSGKRKRAEDVLEVTLADVPVYLRNSELYKSLKENEVDGDEAERVAVPMKCLKPDDIIADNDDLYDLLETLRYWGVEDVPESVYNYFMGSIDPPRLLRPDLLHHFTVVSVLPSIRYRPRMEWLTLAAERGEVRLMKFLRERGHKWKGEECIVAARAGHLDCLQFAHKHGCQLSVSSEIVWRTRYCCCQEAFKNGHLACLQYSQQAGCPPFELGEWVCSRTSAECLKLLLDGLDRSTREQPYLQYYIPGVAGHAIRLGSSACIDKLYDMGWRWELDPPKRSAARPFVSHVVIKTDNAELLEHVVCKGCPLDGNEVDLLIARDNTKDLTLFLDRGQLLSAASQRRLINMGELPLLQSTMERKGCVTTASATKAVAEAGRADLLESAFQHGYAPTVSASKEAAWEGNLPLLQCAVQHGCPMKEVGAAAAEGGHLACLQFLHEHGAPLGKTAIYAAVGGGHLACLQYLHEQCGCPLTKTAVDAAIFCDCAMPPIHE